MSKSLLNAGLLCGLGLLAACAAGPRDPVLGTPGPSFSGPAAAAPASSPSARASAVTNADRQPAGVTNGNQPDRSVAGGGAR